MTHMNCYAERLINVFSKNILKIIDSADKGISFWGGGGWISFLPKKNHDFAHNPKNQKTNAKNIFIFWQRIKNIGIYLQIKTNLSKLKTSKFEQMQ